jgi:hypothetical protein
LLDGEADKKAQFANLNVLQRLVFILDKIDSKNECFKQQQLAKARSITNEVSKNTAVDAIEQIFSEANKYNAYGKKLMLIENCIYGVDIQPIAIQICKLHFLLIEGVFALNK